MRSDIGSLYSDWRCWRFVSLSWTVVGAYALITGNVLPRQASLHLRTTVGHSPYGGVSVDGDRVSEGGNPMAKPANLLEAVQRFGYAKTKKIKLYGKELELVSDPINRQGDDVFIDAREKRTGQVKEVQVPRNIVEMAKSSTSGRKGERRLGERRLGERRVA